MSCPRVSILLNVVHMYQCHVHMYQCCLNVVQLQEDDPHQQLLIEAIKNDCLRDIERERKATAEKTILTAAKLIAPVIEASFALGFDW